MQAAQQLQDEVSELQQQATEQTEHSAAELSSLTEAKAMLQQHLDKAVLDLEASAAGQANLADEVSQWKAKAAKLQKVGAMRGISSLQQWMLHFMCYICGTALQSLRIAAFSSATLALQSLALPCSALRHPTQQ